MIGEFLKSRTGVIIISILWGLGLSTLFRKSCLGRKCQVVQYTGPDPIKIQSNYYNYGTKSCYQYKPILTQCPKYATSA